MGGEWGFIPLESRWASWRRWWSYKLEGCGDSPGED